MAVRKSKNRSSTPIYAIVGDGYSEKIYFEQLREMEQIQNIQIKPELPNNSGKGGNFMRIFTKCLDFQEDGYEKIYAIIDFDAVIEEKSFNTYCKEKAKVEKKGIVVLECNPCFEIWYLLHFKKVGKAFSKCDDVATDIKNNTDLKDYSKHQDYYHKKNLYKFLHPHIETAFKNADFLEKDREDKALSFPRAEVFKLIQHLRKIKV
jgi:RloB-like protein